MIENIIVGKLGRYPCGTSSVIMRSNLLSSRHDVYRKSSPHFCCALEVLHQVVFFLSAYMSLFLVCLKVLRFLFIRSLFNFFGEHSLHLSDVEIQLMDVVDDKMTHVVICLVYWNK
jgi:hypothetical protein